MNPPLRSADLAIVGAGPAGCAAAITAVRAGLRVIVVDRAEFPRDKTCGDGLTTNALRIIESLGLGLADLRADDDLGYLGVRDVRIVSPTGRRVDLALPDRGEYAAVISRRRLDAALVAATRDAGAEVRTGHAVVAVHHIDHDVVLTLADGDEIRARHVVAADGHWSTVRKLVRPTHAPYLGEWHAVRQYHRAVDTDRLWVLFERDLLPGYAWVFPLPGGHANVGYGVLRRQGRTGKDLKTLWPDLLARPSLREVLGATAEPTEVVRAWPIPTRYDPSALTTGRVLFAGDAAAVVDPMTGEGIAQAMETGILAAEAVAGGGDIAAAYRRTVHRALGRDLRLAAGLSRVLSHPWGASGALRAVDANAWTRRQFARWMFEDYPRATIATPTRWSAAIPARSGAWPRG